MFSPIVITEHSGGTPLHAYLSPVQTGGGIEELSPYTQMISKNMVVPIGLAVLNHASQLPDPLFEDNYDPDMDTFKEIPDSLFEQCLGMVSQIKKQHNQTLRKRQNKKKRVSKRSWF
jgi:hypothetical protein